MKYKLQIIAFLLLANISFAQITKIEYKVEPKTFSALEEKLFSSPVFDETLAKQIVEKKVPAGHEHDKKSYYERLKREFASRKATASKGKSNSGATHKPTPPPPQPTNANCPNAGFEQYGFGGWNADTWTLSGSSWTVTPIWTPGVVQSGFNAGLLDGQARHTIMTMPPGNNDPLLGPTPGWDSLCVDRVSGLCEIPTVCPMGSGVSVRLGNANSGGETERLVYTMNVNTSNNQFVYYYAVALNNPSGHPAGTQPFFNITVRDQSGNQIGGQCGLYQIDGAAASTDPLFESSQNLINWDSIFYKNWTPVGINLSAYIGQTVTVEFQTGDCAYFGHSGYAYIDATCGATGLALNFCQGQNNALLVAPAGFNNYAWFGPNSTTAAIPGTNCANCDSIYVNGPNINDVYYCTATSPNGCQTTYSVTINYTTVTVQSTMSSPSCQGGFSGSVGVIPTGSLNGYSFAWTDATTGTPVGGNTSVVTGLPPGTYSVVVSSPGCGQYDTTIQVAVSPPVFYTGSQNFCLSPAQVTAPAGSNYVWYDPSGNIIPGATSGTLTVTNPTNNSSYTTVFTNPSGCKDSMKITLTQTVNFSTQNISFCGSSANICAPTGATNVVWYDYTWGSPWPVLGTGSCITINNPNTSPWSPYYYSYTNPTTGCKDSIAFYLQNIPASINVSAISPTCYNDSSGSVTLNISSGFGTTYTLTVTGPQNYSNNSATATTTLSNLPAGSYTANFSDGQCTASTTFSINPINVNVTPNVFPNTICGGAGNPPANVTFNYGSGPPTACQAATTGCASTTMQTIGFGTMQNASTTWPTPYGNWYANEKYQILYTASDLNAAGITAGKIQGIGWDVVTTNTMNTTMLNYTSKSGCTTANDLHPSGGGWGSIPFLTPSFTTVWGPQTHVVTPGWSNHTFTNAYEWDGTTNLVVEICYTWSAQGSFTQNATVNSTATSYNSFLVFNSDMTPACPELNGNQSFMQRPNTRFYTCQSASLPSDFTYNWNPNTGVSGTAPSVNLAPTTTTSYSLTITSIVGGCSKDTVMTITVVNPFTITMPPPDTYCFVSPNDTLTAVTNPAQTGVWSGTGITDAGDGVNAYFSPSTAGIGTFYAYYTAGGAGCTVSDSVLLTVNSSADATISAAGPFCITDNAINLSVVSPGGTFSGPGITNTTTGTFSPAAAGAGTATVDYIISGQCSDTGTVSIVVYPQPVISISSDTTEGCNPTNISFTSTVPAPANGNAQWFFGDGFTGNTQNMIHQYLDTGMYSVTFIYTDANGCSDTVTNTNMVWIHPSVTAAFTATPSETTVIDGTVAFTNLSVGANIYLWEFMDDSTSLLQDPTFMYTDPGTYNVVLWASNQWGCIDSTSNTVIVEPAVALYVPNAFTPGDENNLNDVFLPYISGIDMTTYKLEIYDRWGERIFNTEDAAIGWNGKKNNAGELVQNGVYVYKIYYKNTKNKKVTYVGHVTVVK